MNHADATHIARTIPRDAVLRVYLAPLREYLSDPAVTEVCINRPGEVWVEARKRWTRYDVPALHARACRAMCDVIASYNDRGISTQKPLLSGQLPDGERVFCVIPPCCEPQTASITIRKPLALKLTHADMRDRGLYAPLVDGAVAPRADHAHLIALHREQRWDEFLEAAVPARLNILVAGATGSGKTTLLKKVLIPQIPSAERIITIEDTYELELPHQNVVRLRYESDGARHKAGTPITAKDLLRGCLRMRPDRILLSEVRGHEAYDFIKNVNSGHPGTLCTVHGASSAQAIEMLLLYILESPEGQALAPAEILRLLNTSIHVLVQMRDNQITEIRYDPEHGIAREGLQR